MTADRLNPIAFWFLRHGETDWNAQGLSQGNVDIPLNETGLAQARSAALLLRNRGVTSILSSPLSRAKDTADIVARELGLPVDVDEGLREVSFGVQEGKPMSEWFAAWVEGALTPSGAESFATLTTRGVAAINRCTVRPPMVLVVAHGALFRALRGAMGHEPNVRTRNGVPIMCEPPRNGAPAWEISYAD
ncbi:MAG: histidine phosphatase family protein [Rhodospirillales bacterium 20-64-7]|nr:MAG: histidine phosphatase family protein [Rhodospirillales bacterium 20-64-7]HQT77121.1 histidine phosphatase family protein [Rhodopila sp.]